MNTRFRALCVFSSSTRDVGQGISHSTGVNEVVEDTEVVEDARLRAGVFDFARGFRFAGGLQSIVFVGSVVVDGASSSRVAVAFSSLVSESFTVLTLRFRPLGGIVSVVLRFVKTWTRIL